MDFGQDGQGALPGGRNAHGRPSANERLRAFAVLGAEALTDHDAAPDGDIRRISGDFVSRMTSLPVFGGRNARSHVSAIWVRICIPCPDGCLYTWHPSGR